LVVKFLLRRHQDDGIVVVKVRKEAVRWRRRFALSRKKLGDDAMEGLRTFVDEAGLRWKDEVLSIAGERFERRLGEEIGALRLDIAKEFAAVRVEMVSEFAAVRGEIAEMRVDLAGREARLLRWSFLFWVGQLGAIAGIMAFLLRTIPRP
jgi:hypothetical protein